MTWLDLLVVGGGLLVVAIGLVLVGRPHLARRAGARVVRRRGSDDEAGGAGMKRLLVFGALVVASFGLAPGRAAGASEHAAASPTPLLAYYYIWFTPSSWSRGKNDVPLLGRYSSDDERVMLQHVRWAKAAGINGFLVSWKSTPALDDRLARLIKVADAERFHLGIVYEGLDFHRRPLPIETVRHDLERFAATFATDRAFAVFERPARDLERNLALHERADTICDAERPRTAAPARVGQECRATTSASHRSSMATRTTGRP